MSVFIFLLIWITYPWIDAVCVTSDLYSITGWFHVELWFPKTIEVAMYSLTASVDTTTAAPHAN